MKTYLFYACLLYVLCINLIAMIVVLYDKIISKKPRGSIRRIPEKTFVRFSMLGGGIGTLLTMFLIRHKTKEHMGLLAKIAFFTTLWCILFLWILKK